ncbi:PREDICTED: protein RFT1 homolog [Fragaria vesca subsp. vesca]
MHHSPELMHLASSACILELLAEPLYILSQNLLLLKLRLAVETAATFFHSITTAILFGMRVDMEKEIIFALSQTAYGMCLFLGYWVYFLRFRPYRSSALFPFRSKEHQPHPRNQYLTTQGINEVGNGG